MTNVPQLAKTVQMEDEDEADVAATEPEGVPDGADAPEPDVDAETSNLGRLSEEARSQSLRMLEALLFAASEPLDEKSLAHRLPEGVDVKALLYELQAFYAPRGVNLVPVGGKWLMRTAEDLSFLLQREAVQTKRLSRPAMETLAIIAYHQPVTRAEIEDIRGVQVSKGTLDVLLETGWVRPRGRRRTPGRPLTYGTSEDFLVHFGLESVRDLPGADDLKAAGLLDARLPPDFSVPQPEDAGLGADEDPLDEDDTGEDVLELHEASATIGETQAGEPADAATPIQADEEVRT